MYAYVGVVCVCVCACYVCCACLRVFVCVSCACVLRILVLRELETCILSNFQYLMHIGINNHDTGISSVFKNDHQ